MSPCWRRSFCGSTWAGVGVPRPCEEHGWMAAGKASPSTQRIREESFPRTWRQSNYQWTKVINGRHPACSENPSAHSATQHHVQRGWNISLLWIFGPKMRCLHWLSTMLSFTAVAGTSGSLQSPMAFLQKQHGKQFQFCGRGRQQLQWWDKPLENGTLFWLNWTLTQQAVLPCWPCHSGGLASRRNHWGIAALRCDLNRVGFLGEFFFFFFQRKLAFSSGKTYAASVQNVFL